MKLVGVLFEWKGGRGVCEMCEEKTFKDGRVDGVQLVRAKGQSGQVVVRHLRSNKIDVN